MEKVNIKKPLEITYPNIKLDIITIILTDALKSDRIFICKEYVQEKVLDPQNDKIEELTKLNKKQAEEIKNLQSRISEFETSNKELKKEETKDKEETDNNMCKWGEFNPDIKDKETTNTNKSEKSNNGKDSKKEAKKANKSTKARGIGKHKDS